MYEKLTNRVMNLLLEGDDYVLRVLREQYQNAEISSIEDTRVGMFVDFLVPASKKIPIQKNLSQNFELGDVHGTIDGSSGGVGFILFVRDGVISMLEGCQYNSDDWEKVTEDIELGYGENGRDIEKLSSSWCTK